MGQTNSSASDTEKSEKSMTVAAGDDAVSVLRIAPAVIHFVSLSDDPLHSAHFFCSRK